MFKYLLFRLDDHSSKVRLNRIAVAFRLLISGAYIFSICLAYDSTLLLIVVGDIGKSVKPFAINAMRRPVDVVNTENGSPSRLVIRANVRSKLLSLVFIKWSVILGISVDEPNL